MSKKYMVTNLLAGLALALTANFALAQGQPDFEQYMMNLAEQQGYSIAVRNASGNPPFAPQTEIPKSTGEDDSLFLPPEGTSSVPVSTNEIKGIVERMSSFIKNNRGKPNYKGECDNSLYQPNVQNGYTCIVDDSRAVGLRSGMLLLKNGNWERRIVKNADGAPTIFNVTDNNLSWYPDYRDSVNNGMRITIGNFHMGNMPFPLRGRLDIPITNISKTVDSAGNTKVVWFEARAANGQAGLPGASNYFEVVGFLPMFNNAISEFFGYFNYETGDWKLKVVVDNNIVPPSPGHVALNLKVYSIGSALQK